MKTWTATEARQRIHEVMRRALAGEPQRVEKHRAGAVIFVSEAGWLRAQANERSEEGQPEPTREQRR